MADISDVENVLVSIVAGILYPTGTGNPSAITAPCNTYRGWPQSDQLDSDLADGKVNVSIFPTNVSSDKTRYLQQDYVTNLPAATFTARVSVSASTVTIAGTVATPQNIAVIAGGVGVSYAVQPADTTTSIATGLAVLLTAAGVPALSSGPIVTVSGLPSSQIIARVGTLATTITELSRESRDVMITLWCPTPDLRDAAAKIIIPALVQTTFLSLPDGSAGRIKYRRSSTVDGLQKSVLYRRDIVYSIEFGTTIPGTAPQILIQRGSMHGGNDPANPLIYQRDT